MKQKVLWVFLFIWAMHSLAVFGIYEYRHLRKWLITPQFVTWLTEKASR